MRLFDEGLGIPANQHFFHVIIAFDPFIERIKQPSVKLTCSPELDPVVVRVSTAREPGKEAQNERQTTHPGPDHRQAS